MLTASSLEHNLRNTTDVFCQERQFIRACLFKTNEITSLYEEQELKNMSLSRSTVAEPIHDIAADERNQLRKSSKLFKSA